MNDSGPKHRVVYDEAMLRDAVRTFVWRRVVLQQKGLWLVAAALLVFLLVLLSRGERGWLVGVLGVTVLLPPLILAAAWVAHSRNSLGRLRAMDPPEAWFVFGQEALATESALGSARTPWSSIVEVWERPRYWMLFFAPAQFITLPVADLSAADLALLRERLRAGRAA